MFPKLTLTTGPFSCNLSISHIARVFRTHFGEMIIQRDSQIPRLCLGDPEPVMLMTELGISNTYIFFFSFCQCPCFMEERNFGHPTLPFLLNTFWDIDFEVLFLVLLLFRNKVVKKWEVVCWTGKGQFSFQSQRRAKPKNVQLPHSYAHFTR